MAFRIATSDTWCNSNCFICNFIISWVLVIFTVTVATVTATNILFNPYLCWLLWIKHTYVLCLFEIEPVKYDNQFCTRLVDKLTDTSNVILFSVFPLVDVWLLYRFELTKVGGICQSQNPVTVRLIRGLVVTIYTHLYREIFQGVVSDWRQRNSLQYLFRLFYSLLPFSFGDVYAYPCVS